MNVLLINGSPHAHGCTDAALQEIASVFAQEKIQTTLFCIGSQPVGGCTGCGACHKLGRCAFGGPVNEVLPLIENADGFVFGAPVHYAEPSANMLGFLHRLATVGGNSLRHKPAAVIASARRAGTTTALEALEKVPQFFEMPLVSSTYWPMVHGNTPEEVAHDEEGLQIMRNLAHNMAWLLRCIEAGRKAGIEPPQAETAAHTNFIR
jgi:multimeric flavodoxin WrbA